MKKQYRKALWVATAFSAVLLLYLPFRLLAQRYNTVFPGFVDRATGELYHPDNFYHWFSVAIWPTYALLSGLIPMLATRRAGGRWWLMIPAFIIAFILWDQVVVLDDWFRIPGGGLSGFRSYPSNHPGMNTPHLSVMLCPFAFLGGAFVGTLAGQFPRNDMKQTDHAEQAVGGDA